MKVIVVASGKGGTGKTSLSAGVSAALAQLGRRVLVIDGDSGLRNLDIVLGLSDSVVFSFDDVARGVVSLQKAAAAHPLQPGLFMLTAPSSVPALAESGIRLLGAQAEEMGFDYVIIDGPAGLAPELRAFASIATQGIVITTPEGASLRGAERVARLLEEENIMRIRLVVNRLRTQLVRHGLASNIDDAMDTAGLPLLGIVPEDEDVIACGNSGKLVIDCKRAGAALAYRNIARRLEGERLPIMRL
ncbi:MAG: septum site-determining protein MinD [Clostridia bacterium]|nr:septum site-determining protein MinD [Clostridia bacterium]